jgi:hypothetical protein
VTQVIAAIFIHLVRETQLDQVGDGKQVTAGVNGADEAMRGNNGHWIIVPDLSFSGLACKLFQTL